MGDINFYVDGRPHRFDDPRQSAIAIGVVAVAPRCLSFEEIKLILVDHGREGGICADGSLDTGYVRKKVMQINRNLLNSTGYRRVISSLRGEGYILASDWLIYKLIAINQTVSQDVETLNTIIYRCIGLVESSSFVTDCEDTKVLQIADGTKKTFHVMFSDLSTRLLSIINLGNGSQAAKDAEDTFNLLNSYVIFARSGKSISDEDWRRAYRSEIIAVYRDTLRILAKADLL